MANPTTIPMITNSPVAAGKSGLSKANAAGFYGPGKVENNLAKVLKTSKLFNKNSAFRRNTGIGAPPAVAPVAGMMPGGRMAPHNVQPLLGPTQPWMRQRRPALPTMAMLGPNVPKNTFGQSGWWGTSGL